MAKEVFDQDRPRSAMAQRLDDAFAGCEEWTVAPPSPRRADALDVAPWLTHSARPTSFASTEPESRAA